MQRWPSKGFEFDLSELDNFKKSATKDGLAAYYNTRSLRNKIDQLRGRACIEKLEFTAIQKHDWILQAKSMSELETDDYQMFRKDRKGKSYIYYTERKQVRELDR